MKIKDIEEKFNIGIPCYNHTFLKLKSCTLKCYTPGVGNLAINKERELREESKKIIEKELGIKDSKFADGLFHYMSIGANTIDSNTQFGFGKTAKLCSLFYKNQKDPIYDVGAYNIYESVEKKLAEKPNPTLDELYKIKNKLLSYDFTDLENQYFCYLNEYELIKYILEKQCLSVVYAVKNKDLISAQKYLFTLTAYLKEYGNINLTVNKEETNLKEFIKTMINKYDLKDEYLLRSSFIDKTRIEVEPIINSIINKSDIVLLDNLCKSGHVDRKKSEPTGKKRIPLTEEDLRKIEQEINDRRIFFLNLNPVAEIKPETGSFKQYCAFVYENGIIVADRLYNITTLNALNQNAIYKFDALNFDELKELSKQDLIGKKIYHTGTWKPRTKKYITQDTPEELHEAAKELVKRKSI